MTASNKFQPDPRLDLVLDRIVDVPPSLVWAAWTQPEHLCKWFCPLPWKVVECEIEVRPGGIFRNVMRGPGGEEHNNVWCILEAIPEKRLVYTTALGPNFRPNNNSFVTAIIELEPHGTGTHYVATALHKDEETQQEHVKMGFYQGWSAVLDQLVALVKTF